MHVDLHCRVEDVLRLLREELAETLPLAGHLRETTELLQGLRVRRLDREGASVGVEGALVDLELTLVDRRDLVQTIDLRLRIVGVPRHHIVDVDELLPLCELIVERREHLSGQHRLVVAVDDPAERLDRPLVVGGELEDVAVGLDGLDGVHQLGLPEVADPEAILDLGLPLAVELDGALEDLELVGPTLRLTVETIQRQDRVVVVRLEVEDLPVGVHRQLEVREALLVDLAEHVEDLSLHLRLGRRELDLAAVDVLEINPRLGLHVELLEGVQRGQIRVVDPEHLLIELDRPGGVLHHRLANIGRVEEERLAVVHALDHVRLADDSLDEGVKVVRPTVELDERVDRGEVRGIDPENAIVRRRRLGRVVEHSLVDLGHLEEDQDPQSVVQDVGDRVLIEADQLRIGAHLPREVLDAPLRLLARRISAIGPAEGVKRRLLIADDLM